MGTGYTMTMPITSSSNYSPSGISLLAKWLEYPTSMPEMAGSIIFLGISILYEYQKSIMLQDHVMGYLYPALSIKTRIKRVQGRYHC